MRDHRDSFPLRLGVWLFSLSTLVVTRFAGAAENQAPRNEAAPATKESPVEDRTATHGSALNQGVSKAGSTEGVELPELIEFVAATYPRDALANGITGDVVLQLTIDTSGVVNRAEVMVPCGDGLDEAARDAALRFRFRPAHRGETPLAVKIRYTYQFRLPPAAPAGAPDENAKLAAAVPPAEPAVTPVPKPLAPKSSVEVTVRGKSAAQRLRDSAQAVTVVETKQAKQQSADMGEILARTEGVGVRRSGGLGSDERISLNGLTDDQIRFFVDGVPLDYSGYSSGISSIPVNFVEQVEIYQGVVPIRFGADALGGAINLVTDSDVRGSKASASYEVGSFGTYRATLGMRYLYEPSGFFVRMNGFVDYAKNDFPVHVEVPDADGQLHPARVRRFHDKYGARGGGVELGFVDRPWARRLLLHVYTTNVAKDVQNNLVMTVPYGEVNWKEGDQGATLRYDQRLGRGLFLESVTGYAYSVVHFLDVAECVYDWFGDCVRERRRPGEVDADPKDQRVWQHGFLSRPSLSYTLASGHLLRATVTTNYVTQTGEDKETPEGARDPLSAERRLITNVSGLEYQLDAFANRLENIVFIKHYLQQADAEEPLAGGVTRRRDHSTSEPGVGDALRFRFTDWLSAKISYEWATRLPRPDEIFGDGVLILGNLNLVPERSHNANLGVSIGTEKGRLGEANFGVNGFLRDAHDLIVLLGNDREFTYQNVYTARSLGFEANSGWTSPREYLTLNTNVTWQSFRNTSTSGTFGDFSGDRIPNRPWFFANFSAITKIGDVISPRDELSLHWDTRYVKKFFRGWESLGQRQYKQTVPTQFTHDASLVYVVKASSITTSTSFEVQNVTNQRVYDFYGVERPGRAFFWKGTLEL